MLCATESNLLIFQVDPSFNLTYIPEISASTMRDDLFNLLENSDEMDTIHDVTFKVNYL